jgi:hypothetical protein
MVRCEQPENRAGVVEIYGDWNDDPALLETTIKYLLAEG